MRELVFLLRERTALFLIRLAMRIDPPSKYIRDMGKKEK